MIGATLDIEPRPDSTVATIRGGVDSTNAAPLLKAIEQCITVRRPRVILDISDLDYFDSAGVYLVFRLARQLTERGGELVVVAPATSIAGSALHHASADSALTLAASVPAVRPAPT